MAIWCNECAWTFITAGCCDEWATERTSPWGPSENMGEMYLRITPPRQGSVLQEKDNDFHEGEARSHLHLPAGSHIEDIWGGLREMDGPPTEQQVASQPCDHAGVLWHSLSNSECLMLSLGYQSSAGWSLYTRCKQGYLSLGSRKEFPDLDIGTSTMHFSSSQFLSIPLMRKPNIFQCPPQKIETLFNYTSRGSIIVFDNYMQSTCLHTSLRSRCMCDFEYVCVCVCTPHVECKT